MVTVTYSVGVEDKHLETGVNTIRSGMDSPKCLNDNFLGCTSPLLWAQRACQLRPRCIGTVQSRNHPQSIHLHCSCFTVANMAPSLAGVCTVQE